MDASKWLLGKGFPLGLQKNKNLPIRSSKTAKLGLMPWWVEVDTEFAWSIKSTVQTFIGCKLPY